VRRYSKEVADVACGGHQGVAFDEAGSCVAVVVGVEFDDGRFCMELGQVRGK
jgi:hypothetical protein